MSFSETISPLLGRAAIARFFLSEVFTRAGAWQANVQLLEMRHLPVAPLLMLVALIVMILGGLSLLLGFHARYGALLLFAFTLISTMLMHDFWHITSNPGERAADYEIFARNIAIAGALLMMVGIGAGPLAVDNRMGGGGGKRH